MPSKGIIIVLVCCACLVIGGIITAVLYWGNYTCPTFGSDCPAETTAGTPVGTPVGTPAGTPARSPVGTPVGTPARSPVGTPVGTPAGTPARSPVGTPVGTPAGTPARSPVGTPPAQSPAPVCTTEQILVNGLCQQCPWPKVPKNNVCSDPPDVYFPNALFKWPQPNGAGSYACQQGYTSGTNGACYMCNPGTTFVNTTQGCVYPVSQCKPAGYTFNWSEGANAQHQCCSGFADEGAVGQGVCI